MHYVKAYTTWRTVATRNLNNKMLIKPFFLCTARFNVQNSETWEIWFSGSMLLNTYIVLLERDTASLLCIVSDVSKD